MKIIISPAKKMNIDTDTFPVGNLPRFLEETKSLLQALRELTQEQLQALWGCNEKLAALNFQRLRSSDPERNLTPAVLAYEGLQYQHMAPRVFTESALEYIGEHLCILSGFYGVLRPFDGVIPYRLEMQAKLTVDNHKDLYAFWGDRLYEAVMEDNRDRTIVNLASGEYARAVEPYRKAGDRFVTVEFCEMADQRLKQKGTHAKMARGEMVRYMAERGVAEPEDMRHFSALGYQYVAKLSSDEKYVFVKCGS